MSDDEALIAQYRSALVAAGRRPSTVTARAGDIERFARTLDCNLVAVTKSDLIRYFAHHPEWKPEYRKKLTNSFRSFFRWAHAEGHIDVDAAASLPNIRVPRTPRPPAPDDLILDAFAKATTAEKAILLLAATMGLRRTEIATLHPAQRSGTKLTIAGKGGRSRILTLNSDTLIALHQLEQTQGPDLFYFPDRFGGHLHPTTVYKWIKRHLGDGWQLHSLRRRAAKVGFSQTHDLRAMQEFLGHESLDTTALYIQVTEDEVAKVAEATSLATSITRIGAITSSVRATDIEIARNLRSLLQLANSQGKTLTVQ